MKKTLLISLFLVSMEVFSNTQAQQEKKKAEPVRINFYDYMEVQKGSTGDREMIKDLSKTVRPQDDFYNFVNENWINRTEIPRTRPSWGPFSELSEKNQDFKKEIINELKKKKSSQLSADEKKILTLYNSFIDMKKRDSLGYKPVKADLEKIDNIKSIDEFQSYNIEMTKEGKSFLYGWAVGTDLNSSLDNAVYIESAELGLSRDYYQKETEDNKAVLEEYKKYISDVLSYAGEKDTEEKASRIVELERKIAKTLLTNEESHDVKKYNNPRKVSELSKITKNIDLARYLKELGVNTENVIVGELKYFENLDKIMTDDGIAVIKDYMKFHLLTSSASLLTNELGERTFQFYGKYLNGQKEREILEKRGLYFVDRNLGELIGKKYIKKNFSEASKKDTEEMVKYIIKAFERRIRRVSWMSLETKRKALEKLGKITVKIGYPDKWKDYSTLVISDKDSLYAQARNMAIWSYNEDLKKVGKPVDKSEWFMAPHEINAYYSPTRNEIVFPAGILQFPFYDLKKSGAGSNFGAIGVVIGHELTHGFDVSGANFDGDGNVKDWWNKDDRKKFDLITKSLSSEFSKYSVAPGVYLNGEYTLTENIADLGGVNIAYEALQLYLRDYPWKNVLIDSYNQNQIFFMSFARVWQNKSTEEYLKNLVKSDSHSPGYFRVNGTIINVDYFHDAFKTKQGDKHFKPSTDRIRIW